MRLMAEFAYARLRPIPALLRLLPRFLSLYRISKEATMRRFTAGIASFVLIAACTDSSANVAPTAPDNANLAALASGHTMAAKNTVPQRDIARLRALVASRHTVDKAIAGGWTTDITGCLELPGVGGMGHHYANLAWLNDAEVRWDKPELLVFGPSPNKRDGLKLVAVEYIVFTALSPTPPVVFGQTLHFNPDVDAWVLHVWIGDHNPTGIFEDWNPTISCPGA
jgi:hypothetical protein